MRQAGSISFACLVTTAALAGCVTSAVPRAEPRPRVEVITSEDIAKSAYTNAWDLLRGKARRYDFVEDMFGRPRSIRIRRGRSTINMAASDTPMILVDGARLSDITALRDLPTDAIQSIELMSGIRGTASQGTNSSAGVIYIHTWEASESGSARKRVLTPRLAASTLFRAENPTLRPACRSQERTPDCSAPGTARAR